MAQKRFIQPPLLPPPDEVRASRKEGGMKALKIIGAVSLLWLGFGVYLLRSLLRWQPY
jgi:hypothetical protein